MTLKGLDDLAAKGHTLLDEGDPVDAHSSFNRWVTDVARWLTEVAPDTGISADWLRQLESPLIRGGGYHDDDLSWAHFRTAVRSRLTWLSGLPSKLRGLQTAAPATVQAEAQASGRREIKLHTTARAYVDPDRIEELKGISDARFDLTKLVRLCEELNLAFAGECYLTIAMITRAILDHVPPILGRAKFADVANNYAGSKSFKESMQNLENSSRKIADQHLHGQVRSSETLPTVRQVDFSNDLDVLLAEVSRLLKKP
jgi:hypothetical protein